MVDAAQGWTPLPDPDRNGQYGSLQPAYCQGLCKWIVITDNDPSGINVSRLNVEVTEEDDTGETYQLSMITQPREDVTVMLSGLEGTDVTAMPDSVTFTEGDWETPKTVTLTAIADDDTVDDEAAITHTPQGRIYAGQTIDSVRVTVKENDKGVNLSPPAMSIVEGDADGGTYTVWLNTRPSSTVTVAITGDTGTDLTLSTTSLTLTRDNWDTPQRVKVTAASDTDMVDDMATLTHTSSGGDHENLPAATLVVTVLEVDDRGITATPTAVTVDEGGETTYTVVLDSQPSTTVTVELDAGDQNGFTTDPEELTFSTTNWDTEQRVTVRAPADHNGRNETGAIIHRPTGGGYDGAPSDDVTVTVRDDDGPHVELNFEQATYTVDEGDNVTVKMTLSADPERSLIINLWRNNQDGLTFEDYDFVPDCFCFYFESGDTESSLTISTKEDTIDDDGESLRITLNTLLPAGVSAGATDESTVNITDDDHPLIIATFEQSSYTVAESDDSSTTDMEEHKVEVKVTLSGGPGRSITIPITKADQNGATSADYAGVPAGVTFGANDTEKSFTFTARHDTVDDDGESVLLGFGTLPSMISAGTNSTATVSINDDDDPEVTVSFGAGSYAVPEGGAVKVKVTLNADPERTVTISTNTAEQGGASSADYSGVSAAVTFNVGETEKEFTVNGLQDDVDDDDESVKLTFGTMPFRVSAGTTDEAIVNITDDDVPFVKVDFANGIGTVQEGYNLGVKVVLDVDPERTVTIPIVATEHDGATHHDYSIPGSVTFSAGETESYLVFNAIHDNIDEDDERVVLRFGTPLPHRVSVGNPGMTDITITDDDGDQQGQPILVGFRVGKHSLPRGGEH